MNIYLNIPTIIAVLFCSLGGVWVLYKIWTWGNDPQVKEKKEEK